MVSPFRMVCRDIILNGDRIPCSFLFAICETYSTLSQAADGIRATLKLVYIQILRLFYQYGLSFITVMSLQEVYQIFKIFHGFVAD